MKLMSGLPLGHGRRAQEKESFRTCAFAREKWTIRFVSNRLRDAYDDHDHDNGNPTPNRYCFQDNRYVAEGHAISSKG